MNLIMMLCMVSIGFGMLDSCYAMYERGSGLTYAKHGRGGCDAIVQGRSSLDLAAACRAAEEILKQTERLDCDVNRADDMTRQLWDMYEALGVYLHNHPDAMDEVMLLQTLFVKTLELDQLSYQRQLRNSADEFLQACKQLLALHGAIAEDAPAEAA